MSSEGCDEEPVRAVAVRKSLNEPAVLRQAEVLGMTGSRGASIWTLVLRRADRARRVHEPASRPQRRRPASRIRGCSAPAPRPAPGSCASARRGATGASRDPSTAGRPARGRSRCRKRLAPRPRPRRPRSRRRGAPRFARTSRARRGSCSTATTSPSSPISAARWVVFAPGAAHRSSTRSPGCGSTARATSIDPRDWGISAPRSNSAEPCRSYGSSSTMPSGRSRRRVAVDALRAPAPAARRRGSRAACSTRAALSAGSLSVAIRAAPRRAPSCSHQACATHSGCEWRSAASAGVDSPSPASDRAPLPRRPPQHRVHEPVAAAPRRLGEVDGLRDRRVVCDAVHEQELVGAEPQRRQHGGVESPPRGPLSDSITWSSVARRCTTPYARRIANARSRPSSSSRSASARNARSA